MIPDVPGIEAWVEADAVTLPGWVVRSGTVWFKDGDRCLPASVDDAAHARLSVRACAGPAARCDVQIGLEGGLVVRGTHCRGATGDERFTHAPEAHPWPLGAASDEAARWSAPLQLVATFEAFSSTVGRCTPKSLKALAREARRAVGPDEDAVADWLADRGVVDDERRCDTSSGLALHEVPLGSGLGFGHGSTSTDAGVVDCGEPCPENPASVALAGAEVALADRVYTRPDAPWVAAFTTEAGCLAAAPAAAWLPPVPGCGP